MRALSRRIEVGGVGLAVEERGAGPALVLLHGFTGSAAGLAPLAQRLAGEFRVLAVDLVGHGASDAPDDVAAYGFERCVDQVAALIEATHAAPAHVFGYSMGGRVALGLGVRHPERVRSLALLGASAGLPDADERAARRRSDEALATRIESEGVAAFAENWARLPLFASQEQRMSRAGREALHAQRLANCARGLANSLRGMGTGAQPALHDQLPALAAPVWLAHGAEDAKFAAIARDLAERIPHACACAIPAAGHAAHLENPDAVCDELVRFLAEVEAARRFPVRGPEVASSQGARR